MFVQLLSYLGDLDQRTWWLFRAASTLHFVGLCLLVGALLVVDLRALGVIKGISHSEVASLARVAALGLLINVASGVVMLASRPEQYWDAWPFRWKMLILGIAVLNAFWFTAVGEKKMLAVGPAASAPFAVKLSAALSLVAWLLVILLGRTLFEFASSG